MSQRNVLVSKMSEAQTQHSMESYFVLRGIVVTVFWMKFDDECVYPELEFTVYKYDIKFILTRELEIQNNTSPELPIVWFCKKGKVLGDTGTLISP